MVIFRNILLTVLISLLAFVANADPLSDLVPGIYVALQKKGSTSDYAACEQPYLRVWKDMISKEVALASLSRVSYRSLYIQFTGLKDKSLKAFWGNICNSKKRLACVDTRQDFEKNSQFDDLTIDGYGKGYDSPPDERWYTEGNKIIHRFKLGSTIYTEFLMVEGNKITQRVADTTDRRGLEKYHWCHYQLYKAD